MERSSVERRHARRPVRILLGIGILTLLAVGSELLMRLLAIPLPGPVVGLIVLVLIVHTPLGESIERFLGPGADVLIALLPLMLVPLAVGVIDSADELGRSLMAISATLIGGWLVAFIVTAVVCLLFRRRLPR
jgi:holin-like protein